jgi:hypothetical protein
MLHTAVVLCIFDRPQLTQVVFDKIAAAAPRRLFVVADGPATPEQAAACAAAQEVTRRVTWECDASYDIAPENLGARRRFATGLDWVFSQVDDAIVLEDDCVPEPTFFTFCETLLDHYRDEPRVMMISGGNYLERWYDDRQSYHFSHFGSTYGWATWARAWQHYDTTMAAWAQPEVKARIKELLDDDEVFAVQSRRFDWHYEQTDNPHPWDVQWVFARLEQDGLAVVPAVNLVSNVGNEGGRGIDPAHPLSNLPTRPLPMPIRFQDEIRVDRTYDRLHVKRITGWGPQVARRNRGDGARDLLNGLRTRWARVVAELKSRSRWRGRRGDR